MKWWSSPSPSRNLISLSLSANCRQYVPWTSTYNIAARNNIILMSGDKICRKRERERECVCVCVCVRGQWLFGPLDTFTDGLKGIPPLPRLSPSHVRELPTKLRRGVAHKGMILVLSVLTLGSLLPLPRRADLQCTTQCTLYSLSPRDSKRL